MEVSNEFFQAVKANVSTAVLVYVTVVYTCKECSSSGCGRDLNFAKNEEIPETLSDTGCPCCGEFTLKLDREKTYNSYKITVPQND
jgi:Zn finger protein HypA/HybF involved in hydrogenase expression